jgi:hypothetical protein
VLVLVVYHYSNFEEVGHGASAGIPDDVAELIAVDMGVLGEGLQGNEHAVSIYAKDSGDPFDLGIRRRLVAQAQAHGIPYKLNISIPSTVRMPRRRCVSAALRLGVLKTLTTLRDWHLKLSAISNTVQPGSPVSAGLFSFLRRMV